MGGRSSALSVAICMISQLNNFARQDFLFMFRSMIAVSKLFKYSALREKWDTHGLCVKPR